MTSGAQEGVGWGCVRNIFYSLCKVVIAPKLFVAFLTFFYNSVDTNQKLPENSPWNTSLCWTRKRDWNRSLSVYPPFPTHIVSETVVEIVITWQLWYWKQLWYIPPNKSDNSYTTFIIKLVVLFTVSSRRWCFLLREQEMNLCKSVWLVFRRSWVWNPPEFFTVDLFLSLSLSLSCQKVSISSWWFVNLLLGN